VARARSRSSTETKNFHGAAAVGLVLGRSFDDQGKGPKMSAKKTKKCCHRAKDGLYYASFQEKVDANKRHIQQKLKEMGLDRSSFQRMRLTSIAKKKEKSSPAKQKTPLEATRRSSRVRKAPPENGGLPEDYMLEIRASEARKKRKKVYPNRTASTSLSEEDRKKLSAIDWLEEMEVYLKNEEQLSYQNHRSVMRQVEKLVAGVGITYHHWNEGVYFMKGQTIQLSDDFGTMHDEAVAFENEHGRDLGNGWLLRHPIKKLENFQRYCWEKRQKPKVLLEL
jgi:hypothetical protein